NRKVGARHRFRGSPDAVPILRACGGWSRRCRPVLDGGEQKEGCRGKAAARSIGPGMGSKCDKPLGSKIYVRAPEKAELWHVYCARRRRLEQRQVHARFL